MSTPHTTMKPNELPPMTPEQIYALGTWPTYAFEADAAEADKLKSLRVGLIGAITEISVSKTSFAARNLRYFLKDKKIPDNEIELERKTAHLVYGASEDPSRDVEAYRQRVERHNALSGNDIV